MLKSPDLSDPIRGVRVARKKKKKKKNLTPDVKKKYGEGKKKIAINTLGLPVNEKRYGMVWRI
jgi:hypothetical protein